ncbi:unnamed protein product [Haemonchus placei]|uniref:Battenin n=1 Tax=Haemonchus placei TaxID=6290 RepID=A0A0N4X7H5_HAEPC|nr:unnamed protein product [Haemonchus placei]
MGAGPEKKSVAIRNMISFWIFGMCNNFAYSVMLGAAQDILKRNSESATPNANNTEHCVEHITFRDCAPASAGVVLICNILPCLIVKLLCPFFMHHIPYGVRHFIICMSQTASLMVTAWANSVPTALLGVLLASFSCGFGETTYLGLASHYSNRDLTRADSESTATDKTAKDSVSVEAQNRPLTEQLLVVKSLLKYMIPFGTVYFMQYFVKQGLTLTTVVIFITAIYAFIPYFGIVCGIMFFIGVVGGTNYANTFYHIHRKVDPTIREFALSTVTFADTIGILAAAVAAIPVHNWICAMK